jgi:predicted TPR repeat methyltransferase
VSLDPSPNLPGGFPWPTGPRIPPTSPSTLPPSAPELYAGRHLEAIAARWDAKAQTWDQELADPACHLNEDDAYRRFLATVRGLIRQREEFCAAQGVIDAGCGTGLVLAEVTSSFRWGIGIDLSEQMIRLAAAKAIPNAWFKVGDCFDLPALCPRAGAVISRGVLLSHYGGQLGGTLLRSAYAALVTGGFLAFDFLNEAARIRYRHIPGNKTYYTPAQARLLADRAGLPNPSVLGGEERRILLLVAQRS